MSFCAAHRLKEHPGHCRNLHGHNYTVTLLVGTNQLQKNGMVIELDTLKDILNEFHSSLDHATILENSDPLIEMFVKHQLKLFVLPHPPTTEILADYIQTGVVAILSNRGYAVRDFVVHVVVDETEKNQAMSIVGDIYHDPARMFFNRVMGGKQ